MINGTESDRADATSGVPQGTVLGPLLFLAYINDLPGCVKSTPRLFADDCLLYRTINSQQDTITLQKDLDNLQIWEQKWLMKFNPDKCEVLRITNKRKDNIINANYNIHGTILNFTTKAKYLGLTFTPNLSWGEHINATAKKANSTRGFIQRNLQKVPQKIKTQAYFTFVRPTLEYASTVWDPSTLGSINQLEMVQHRSAWYVMNDWGRLSSVTAMLNELGWQSLAQRRLNSKLIMMYRITHHLIAIPATPPYITVSTNQTRGHHFKLFMPSSHINNFQQSFFVSTVQPWNNLNSTIIEAPTLPMFKARLLGESK